MENLKMYFVCEFRGSGYWLCYGVLSNGFCFGTHMCSDPVFAPGDLYFNRKQRVSALKDIFGIDPDSIEVESILVREDRDIPEWWNSHAALQDGLKEQYEKYEQLIKPPEQGQGGDEVVT